MYVEITCTIFSEFDLFLKQNGSLMLSLKILKMLKAINLKYFDLGKMLNKGFNLYGSLNVFC